MEGIIVLAIVMVLIIAVTVYDIRRL